MLKVAVSLKIAKTKLHRSFVQQFQHKLIRVRNQKLLPCYYNYRLETHHGL